MFNRELWDKKARIALVDYLKNHSEIVATIPQFISDGNAFWQGKIQPKFIKTSLATVEDIVTAMMLDDIVRQDGTYLFIYILFENILNGMDNKKFKADMYNTISQDFVVAFNSHGEIQKVN